MPPPSESILSTFDCDVEVLCNSETLVCTYKTTPCHISEEENKKKCLLESVITQKIATEHDTNAPGVAVTGG
jgi:hypothetical protein